MTEKFIISRSDREKYQYKLKAKNGQTILLGKGYGTIESCQKDISLVKLNVQVEGFLERKIANKLFYFDIKNGNGKTIGTSGIYSSIFAREGGIQSVKKYASEALIFIDY